MNITKFLLLDAILVIAATPLMFLLKNRNKKSNILRSPNKDELKEKTYSDLPEIEKLLDLEKHARSECSGIEYDSLIGNWKFVSVWKKDTNDEDFAFSSLLKVFSANLELQNDILNQHPHGISISASIQFVYFSIKFSGSGYLKGKQPLLTYYFNLIELKSGTSIWLSKSLKEPVEKSFIELIASDKSEGWLSARVQGVSLVLWLKE